MADVRTGPHHKLNDEYIAHNIALNRASVLLASTALPIPSEYPHLDEVKPPYTWMDWKNYLIWKTGEDFRAGMDV